MMGALLRNSFTINPKGLQLPHKYQRFLAKTKKKGFVHCQSGGSVTKSDKIAPILSERSILKTQGHGAAIMDPNGSSVLTPNGKNTAELVVKDPTLCNGASSTYAQVDKGIGIVKFLRGKAFFVTGATGFLAKGYPHSSEFSLPSIFFKSTMRYSYFRVLLFLMQFL